MLHQNGLASSASKLTSVERRLAWRLRARRKLLGLTLEDVALAAGVQFQLIHKYETGAVRISAVTLWRLARVLRVDVDYFFDGLGKEGARAGMTQEARAFSEA